MTPLQDDTTPRPYLTAAHSKVWVPATQPHPYRLDLTKLLSGTAPISWGALLGSLPKEVANPLLVTVRQANKPDPGTLSMADKVAWVEAAVLRLELGPPPENMFAPFTVVNRDVPLGTFKRDPQSLIH